DCRQARIRLVPDLCRELVTAKVFLELALVPASIQDKPVGPGVSDTVAEDDVQPEADLVDEIVHVSLEAAVVVAHEYHALTVVQAHPAREMDGAHASQPTPRIDVPSGVVDYQ